MFITTKQHHKELEKIKEHYEKIFNRIVEFHQAREISVLEVINDWKDKFKNVSATRTLQEIDKILSIIPQDKVEPNGSIPEQDLGNESVD